MRRGWSALVVILLGASFARADYLFMQYLMGVKRNDPNAPGTPGPTGAPGPAPGGPPPTSSGPGSPSGTTNNDTVVLAVNSVVEITKKNQIANPISGRVKFRVNHKYGATSLYNDESLIIKLIPA